MGYLKYINELYKKPQANLKALLRERLISWRKGNSVVRVDNPTRIDKARALGYKAKEGYIIIRVRLPRGGRKRERVMGGRRSRAQRRKKIVAKSYQWVAEERANKKYVNCEVIGSYEILRDGLYYWYEVILVDRVQVSKYPGMEWVAYEQGRVYRGKSPAARKSRGLLKKGKGAEKIRPNRKSVYGKFTKKKIRPKSHLFG
ncbi:MAG: 50S ribosomal protein L15e [Candidatus Nanoarchaeia archaeon]|nr:50S ribosomal protein L15e [Candidatus Nanoarchaeia archaeon]